MRKYLLALIAMVALLSVVLVGCAASADSPTDDPATPPAGGTTVGADDAISTENPFVGTWKSDGGYVEYRSDGTWVDGADLPDGTFTTEGTGTYEVVAGDGYYELREMWSDPEAQPMVFYVVFSDGKAGFFENLNALEQNEILTMYTETAPGLWER